MRDCAKVAQLFSPYLDGELAANEAARVREHCEACASCRAALAEWDAAALALRDTGPAPVAPAGFASGVMARIAAEKPARRAWWPVGWTKGLAAAAAAAMIFAGSWGLWGGQLGSRVPVAHNDPGRNGPAVPHVVSPDNPAPDNPDVTAPGPGPAPDSSTPGPTGDADTVKPNGRTSSPGDNAQPRDTAAVFTSKPRAVTTTLLKVRVADPAAAREEALALAKEAGAACRDSADVLEITAPAAKAPALADRLAALGSAEVRETDRRDITADFTAALERYQALEAQLAGTEDPEQRAQIEATMASLEKQLKDWDVKSSLHVITLWLAE
ncbi:MAG: zf-HC2 domain-containing protein [Bacillota bacterium]|nr:zf-HC2 domain-containing protein [Bacillota bacterium]